VQQRRGGSARAGPLPATGGSRRDPGEGRWRWSIHRIARPVELPVIDRREAQVEGGRRGSRIADVPPSAGSTRAMFPVRGRRGDGRPPSWERTFEPQGMVPAEAQPRALRSGTDPACPRHGPAHRGSGLDGQGRSRAHRGKGRRPRSASLAGTSDTPRSDRISQEVPPRNGRSLKRRAAGWPRPGPPDHLEKRVSLARWLVVPRAPVAPAERLPGPALFTIMPATSGSSPGPLGPCIGTGDQRFGFGRMSPR
jgi:hypothetical protein